MWRVVASIVAVFIYTAYLNPVLNKSSEISLFKRSDVITICNVRTFMVHRDSHIWMPNTVSQDLLAAFSETKHSQRYTTGQRSIA